MSHETRYELRPWVVTKDLSSLAPELHVGARIHVRGVDDQFVRFVSYAHERVLTLDKQTFETHMSIEALNTSMHGLIRSKGFLSRQPKFVITLEDRGPVAPEDLDPLSP